MNMNINDQAWWYKNPRLATLLNALLVTLSAVGFGAITEWTLLHYGISIAPLGAWSMATIAGSVMVTGARLTIILFAIGLENDPVTIRDRRGTQRTRPVKASTSIGAATEGISTVLKPLTFVLSGIIAATALLLTNQPEIAEQLTWDWIKEYPISTAAFAGAIGMTISDEKAVSRLLGQGPLRKRAVRAGKIMLIAILGIALVPVAIAGVIILLCRVF